MNTTEQTAAPDYDVPMFDEHLTVLPYAGTSGWSGSSTSEHRARQHDRDGTTRERQRTVLGLLALAGGEGLTWKELAEATGWHHGQASGALSVLHKERLIVRLSETRSRCKVYALEEYVGTRETEKHGRKAHVCPNCGHRS